MSSRIVIGGRVIGSGNYGTDAKCFCGERVEVLGRCAKCHEALRRRRLGLPPETEQEAKRLRGYLDKHQAHRNRCRECLQDEGHTKDCYFANL